MSPVVSPAARQLLAGVRALLVLTVVLGLGYPLAVTGMAQVVFPGRADGSFVQAGDEVVGSSLIGQQFAQPVLENGVPVIGEDGVAVTEPDPAYFQPRPSAAGAGYDPLATSASNYGAENPEFVALVEKRRAAVAAFDGVRPDAVAPDALLASGSGLDPDISPQYAEQQVARVARERGLSAELVRSLVAEHTSGRTLGFLGAPHVNVLLLNLALDEAAEDDAVG